MSFESEIKAKFGGFWNSVLLLLVVIVCLRFSSIELLEEDLSARVLYSLYLFLGCLGGGALIALLKVIFSFSNQPYLRPPVAVNVATGLKYGIVAAGLLVFIVGVIQLDNFMGLFQPPINALFAKLSQLIS
ncbi:hypothetical protein SAMN05216419_102424 [Nitrosomonas cryotolerans]|uniref:Uncharacterized protein n=1 Tax=Nitrosomonas cryotolerans ATCC 49181 TaxID=1131553 RepID=A0A1N6ITY6_9PROT|nr:hypothetical protein [Nitrosomonas cryotolerans]SFP84794.1 hypothetical protein SAMN05216419_102424 [Nitrosomonas cryotolerans]SIO35476.1 hypothetical protein SAMN02743940_2073 [Nitrosomonas cryotolerans ATCC 49181]